MVFSGFRAKTLLCLTGNFSGMVFKFAFFLSRRTFVGEIELFRKDTSFDAHCRTLGRKLSHIWQENFCRVVETAFFVSQQKFWSKIFLSKMNLFVNIVKHWAKTCLFLAKNVRHGCQSCMLRVEENFWLKIKWFTKINLLIFFSGPWVEIFRAFGEKVWGEFFKKAFSMSREKIRRKLLCLRPFFFERFKILSQFFFHICGKISEVLSILLSTYPEELFPIFENLNFFSGFWAKTFRRFVSNLSGMVVKTLFHVSGKTFRGKWIGSKKKCFRFFLQFERKYFGFLVLLFEAWFSKVHSACPE